MYYLTFYLESTRAKIDFYSERLKQLAGTSFPPESNNDDHTKGKFYPPILLSVYSVLHKVKQTFPPHQRTRKKERKPRRKIMKPTRKVDLYLLNNEDEVLHSSPYNAKI